MVEWQVRTTDRRSHRAWSNFLSTGVVNYRAAKQAGRTMILETTSSGRGLITDWIETELRDDWGVTDIITNNVSHGDILNVDSLRFESEEHLILFLLRWS